MDQRCTKPRLSGTAVAIVELLCGGRIIVPTERAFWSRIDMRVSVKGGPPDDFRDGDSRLLRPPLSRS